MAMHSSPEFSARTSSQSRSGDLQHYPRAELWEAAYRLLEQNVVAQQLVTWIQPLSLVDVETDSNDSSRIKIRLSAPNDFSAQWVRDHYHSHMQSAFSQITGAHCEIILQVDENQAPGMPPTMSQGLTTDIPSYDSDSSASSIGQGPGGEIATGFQPQQPQTQVSHEYVGPTVSITPGRATVPANDNSLDPRYVFENFVVGASNQFAHASAVAVAEQPARQYNPLFLYSPPGLGKTHLLHAIGNHLIANRPGARVAYLSAEKFVNELIESLQHRKMSQFRTKFRDSYDLILIDDIQFIAGKNTSEEEFFHTFNALHSSKRQIVVTSDRPPKEIEGLEERVRTRFEWGLVADIMPPEIETRIAILKTKAERDDIYLPDDVATFLASCIKSNVRELEGTLIKLQAQASLTGAEISLEMAKHELRNAIPEEGASFTIESIQNAVSKHFHIRIQDLKSTTRTRTVALPRQIGMYLIRKYTGLGFKEIGLHFGGKDHTTILHACNKIEKGMETDPSIREAVEAIQNML